MESFPSKNAIEHARGVTLGIPMQETHPHQKSKEPLSGFAEGTFAVVLMPGPFLEWRLIQTGMSGRVVVTLCLSLQSLSQKTVVDLALGFCTSPT